MPINSKCVTLEKFQVTTKTIFSLHPDSKFQKLILGISVFLENSGECPFHEAIFKNQFLVKFVYLFIIIIILFGFIEV